MTAYWLTGDTRKVMDQLPPGSVDLVLTSPPFLALRSYLPDDDPAKVDEIGSEANPAEFIDTLLDVTEACARLLAPHGTLVVELGDTYAGNVPPSGPATDAWADEFGERPQGSRIGSVSRRVGSGWPLDKSLSLIPEAYRMALAYGRNPHNGRTTDPWRIRNVIRWVRPNPPVGALGDKFRPATSEMVIACKQRDRWFDLDAVRTPVQHPNKRLPAKADRADAKVHSTGGQFGELGVYNAAESAGAPPLDWWQISPGGYSGAHYAVFPPELCIKPIEAMCPRRVCRTCGKPSRRLVTDDPEYNELKRSGFRVEGDTLRNAKGGDSQAPAHLRSGGRGGLTRQATTTGWSTCGCPGSDGIRLDGYHTGPGWRPGIVLDPFGGSGTTASVASGHSRDSISIDLDRRNADLARERIGMWFQEVTPEEMTEMIG